MIRHLLALGTTAAAVATVALTGVAHAEEAGLLPTWTTFTCVDASTDAGPAVRCDWPGVVDAKRYALMRDGVWIGSVEAQKRDKRWLPGTYTDTGATAGATHTYKLYNNAKDRFALLGEPVTVTVQ